MDWDEMVTVGRVVRPHGNRGEVVVAPETDFGADRFAEGARLHRRVGDRIEPIEVATSREHAGRWVVGFDGVASIDAAERLRGAELKIPAEALRALADGTYYLHDLAGCDVRTTDGAPVGTVARVDVLAGQPMLVVVAGEGPDSEVLVPFTARMCPVVDVEAKRIEIDPPEGLIDLNRRK